MEKDCYFMDFNELNKKIGKRIKSLRKECGYQHKKSLTQKELSEELHKNTGYYVSVHTLSNIEKGKSPLEVNLLMALSKYFNVSYDYILCESEIKNEDDLVEHLTKPYDEKDLVKCKKIPKDFIFNVISIFVSPVSKLINEGIEDIRKSLKSTKDYAKKKEIRFQLKDLYDANKAVSMIVLLLMNFLAEFFGILFQFNFESEKHTYEEIHDIFFFEINKFLINNEADINFIAKVCSPLLGKEARDWFKKEYIYFKYEYVENKGALFIVDSFDSADFIDIIIDDSTNSKGEMKSETTAESLDEKA